MFNLAKAGDLQVIRIMATAADDFRYAIRVLSKHRTFTLMAVATLALATGANTAIFSVARAVLLEPLPYPDGSQLVMVWEDATASGFPENTPAPANYADWKSQNTVFKGMAATRKRAYVLTGAGEPDRLSAHQASIDFFSVIGVQPAIGRALAQDDDVVLSDAFWKSRFGGSREIVGESVLLDGARFTVAGVMPAGFEFPERGTQIWTPLNLTPEQMHSRDNHYLQVVARLKPGVTLEQARTEMDTIARRLEQQYPATNDKTGIRVNPLREQLVGTTGNALLLLLVVVGSVLLIASGNLANLLLARAVSRQKEVGVRIALGARRITLLRQLFMENLLLSAAGTLLGLFISVWSFEFLSVLVPASLQVRPTLDTTVVVFALVLCILTTLLFGAVPMRQTWRLGVAETLRQSGARSGEQRATHGIRSKLVISQTAFTFVLLVAGGLMLRTFSELRSIDPGFRGENVLTLRTALPVPKYRGLEPRAAFYSQVLERVRALPGVIEAGYTSWLPYRNLGGSSAFTIEGRPAGRGLQYDANVRLVTPGYMPAMGMRLIEGRVLTAADRAGTEPVIVVNETMSRKFFQDEDPTQHRLRLCDNCPWFRIVGIVADVHQKSLETDVRPEYFVPFDQVPQFLNFAPPQDLAIRVAGDPLAVVVAARSAVWSVDDQQPVTQVKVASEFLTDDLAPRKFQTQLIGGFAVLALLLASVGIYGVLSYAVSARQREIGVRIALGAQPAEVVRWITSQGMRPALIGLSIGAGVSLVLSQLMSKLLFGVKPRDPMTFGLAVLVLIAVALLASWIPARRAGRVDPMTVLHNE